MKNIVDSIDTEELCSYGCGQVAKFKNKSNKLMCCKHYNSCPANRAKNSQAVLNAYKSGKKKSQKDVYRDLPQDKKDKMNWNKGNVYADFSYNGRGNHKQALINERGHCCERCGLSEWFNEPISLELEHVDADRKNNTKDNLKLLCLNCHSQTKTWKRGKDGGGWKVNKYSEEEIIEAVKSSTCLSQVLKKLDLRYGSVQTIIKVMVKHRLLFKDEEI